MRLWTLHPRHLDGKGLVALWREALLAQAVLRGETRGYTRHPQLERFRASYDPLAAIASYLDVVWSEAGRRGYSFDVTRLRLDVGPYADQIDTTDGQLEYEWLHLCFKLEHRDPRHLASLIRPTPHPLFRIVPGSVADWERVRR
jgi:hypothetical protein